MVFVSLPATLPTWCVPFFAFLAALAVALGGAAWFTRLLEALSDHWEFSPGLLGLIGALGANIPNYTASLTAFADHQPLSGLRIVMGSNIYNVAIIVGIAVFAVPAHHGLTLKLSEERDALTVGRLAVAIAGTTLLALLVLTLVHVAFSPVLLAGINVLALGFFVWLAIHALRRDPAEEHSDAQRAPALPHISWAVAGAMLALAITLGSVVIMVREGEAFGKTVQLPPAILSLVVLAVATSLPNTVVAYQLSRAGRVTTCLEEIFSSNSVNLALGSALPLLIWQVSVHDPLLVAVDAPVMILLMLVVLAFVRARQIARPLGAGLILVYVAWVLVHVLIA